MPEQKEHDTFGDYEQIAEKKRQERAREQRSRDLDQKIVDLANKTVDFILEYGQEDFRSQMMLSFLDVALEMKDVIKMLTSINVAMSCMFEAISFIDSAINFDTMLQEDSLKENYGFFSRWKRKRRIRKVIRNNRNRMTVAIDNILGQQQMAQDIMEALRSSCERMRITMNKRDEKRKKKEEKRIASGKAPTAPAGPSKAQALIADMLKARGEEGGASAAAPETPAPQSGAPQGGVGDISDIL